MKKVLILALTLLLTITLTACGETDATAAIEAFNLASAQMDEACALANPNAVLLESAFMDEMIAFAEEMESLKNELEDEGLTQERADEIEAISQDYLVTIDGFKVEVEEALADPLLSKIQTINEIIIALTDQYNEAAPLAIENGWEADDLTAQELNTLGAFLTQAQTDAFSNELALLDTAQIDALLNQCENLQNAMPTLLERVSTPFTDEK